MKKVLLSLLILTTFTLLSIGTGYTASSVTLNATATVPNSSPELSVNILEFSDGNPDNNPWTNSTLVTAMNFGTLTHTLADGSEAGLWYSEKGFCVVIYTQPFGKPYNVTSTCAGLTSGATSLPAGSFGLTPVYSATDKWVWVGGSVEQGPMPTGATLGVAGSAIGGITPILIYSSELGTATARIIQAYYGLPPFKAGGVDPFPGFTKIPLSQAPGSYTGTATISIVLK